MVLVEWVQRRRLLAAALAGAVMGAVVGLFLPIRAADPPKADEANWSLPNAQALKRFSDNSFQSVRAAKFWGELLMPGQRGNEKKVASWTLTGIVTRPLLQVSVTEQGKQGKPEQTWVRVGGKLPDGAVLDSISRDRVWFIKDGCKQVRSLYQSPLHPDPEGCIGADGKPVAQAAGAGKPSTAAATPTTSRAANGAPTTTAGVPSPSKPL